MGVRQTGTIKIKKRLAPLKSSAETGNGATAGVPEFFRELSRREYKHQLKLFKEFLSQNLDQWQSSPVKDIREELHPFGVGFADARPPQHRGYGWFFTLHKLNGAGYTLKMRVPNALAFTDMNLMVKKYQEVYGNLPDTWEKPMNTNDRVKDKRICDFFKKRGNQSYYQTDNDRNGKMLFHLPNPSLEELQREGFDGLGIAYARTMALDSSHLLQGFLAMRGDAVASKLEKLDITNELQEWYHRNGFKEFKDGTPVFENKNYPRGCDHWWE